MKDKGKMMKQPVVIGVIVTYFPDEQMVARTINSIVRQVSRLLIIDNTPDGSAVFKSHGLIDDYNHVELIALNENTGIARAQNIGIKKASESGANFILLSDQDTFYNDHFIAKMYAAYFRFPDKEKVAAIVPDFAELNRGGERQGFTQFDGLFLRRIFPKNGCHEITQAISSGKIIPSEVLKHVGLMDEDLFIDWVDLEWCWRARSKGYKIIGCADVVIEHSLGEYVAKIRSRPFPIRSPIRDYYIIRNAVHLSLRSRYLNFGMRCNTFLRSLRYLIGFTILGKPHWRHFCYSVKGFYHGMIRKLGPYQ